MLFDMQNIPRMFSDDASIALTNYLVAEGKVMSCCVLDEGNAIRCTRG